MMGPPIFVLLRCLFCTQQRESVARARRCCCTTIFNRAKKAQLGPYCSHADAGV
jgi:hypothetical protein